MAAKNILKKRWGFLLLIFAAGGCMAANAATPPTDIMEPVNPITVEEDTDKSSYEYDLEGRADPFVPFLRKKASVTQLDPNEIMDETVELTGMRQFEPGQLTLVAVLETNTNKIAMVEDVTGKGYMLNEGTAIGRRGHVTTIDLHQVLITETAQTRAGKKIKNTIVMRLNKEGER
jgi:type IV pilus assembly protein PilP